MAKVLFGPTQDLSLVLEVLAFHLDSRQNVFHLGKMSFDNFLKSPIAFGIILYHFQQISHAMTFVQIHSPKPSLIFGS